MNMYTFNNDGVDPSNIPNEIAQLKAMQPKFQALLLSGDA